MRILAELPDPNNYASIGWVIVVLGVIVVMINQVSEMVARHKQKDPDPPLHKEYASKAEHDALVVHVRQNFQELNEDRRVNGIKIHERIDKSDQRSHESDDHLRSEMKEDIGGIHDRINELLRSFSELKGSVQTALKNSHHPFNKS